MADNEIEVKNELNFFHKIRKNMFLSKLDAEKAAKYTDLPDALKNDNEILGKIIEVGDEKVFYRLPFFAQIKWMARNPDFINQVSNRKVVARLINEMPQIASSVEDTNLLYAIVYERRAGGEFMDDFTNNEFLKYLPVQMQKDILKGSVRYEDSLGTTKSGILPYIRDELQDFSEDGYIAVAIDDANTRLNDPSVNLNDMLDILTLRGIDVKKLSHDAQLKLTMIDNQYIKLVSQEVALEAVGSNPFLISLLPFEMQYRYFQDFPDMVCTLDRKDLDKMSLRGELLKLNLEEFKSPESAIDELIRREYVGSEQMINGYSKMSSLLDEKFLWEMIKLDPMSIDMSEAAYAMQDGEFVFDKKSELNIANAKIARMVLEHAKAYDKYSSLATYIESFIENGEYKITLPKVITQIRKFVADETIMENVPSYQIKEYIDYPSNDKFAKIIGQAYGEVAQKIVEDRPMMSIDDIRTTKIFDKTIIDEFGIGAVHSYISYKMQSAGVISELARNPKRMEEYRKFNKVFGDFYENTAQDLDRKLKSFSKCRALMQNVDIASFGEEEKDALKIVLNDCIDKEQANMILPFPKNLDELMSYTFRKDYLIDGAIQKATSAHHIKKLMAKKYFSMNYEASTDEYLDRPSLQGMCKFYKLDELAMDQSLLDKGEFSKEELDAIGLLSVFNQITSVKVLKELNAELAKARESILPPTAYRQIQNKVQRHYAKEVSNSLLTLEKAKNIEEGIDIAQDEDGYNIVTLKGCKFFCYVTNPNLNFSKLDLKNHDISVTWRTLENGVSTISGSIVSPGGKKSWVRDDDVGLGFGNVPPEQIVGLSSTDILMTHTTKTLRPISKAADKVEFNLPEDHEKEKAIRVSIDDKWEDPGHPADELAITRRKTILSEIKENTSGGRIMPDYVVLNTSSYDKRLPFKIETAKKVAKQFDTQTIFVIDNSAYPERLALLAASRERHQISPRKETTFIDKIKKISNRGDDLDER